MPSPQDSLLHPPLQKSPSLSRGRHRSSLRQTFGGGGPGEGGGGEGGHDDGTTVQIPPVTLHLPRLLHATGFARMHVVPLIHRAPASHSSGGFSLVSPHTCILQFLSQEEPPGPAAFSALRTSHSLPSGHRCPFAHSMPFWHCVPSSHSSMPPLKSRYTVRSPQYGAPLQNASQLERSNPDCPPAIRGWQRRSNSRIQYPDFGQSSLSPLHRPPSKQLPQTSSAVHS